MVICSTRAALLQPEFPALKPTLPTGALPVLEVAGVLYPQSKAIEMYIARKAGLYPADTGLAFVVDVVPEVCFVSGPQS